MNDNDALPPPGSIALFRLEHEIYARERALGQKITYAAERAGIGKRTGAGSKLEAKQEVKHRIAWLIQHDEEIIRERRRLIKERSRRCD